MEAWPHLQKSVIDPSLRAIRNINKIGTKLCRSVIDPNLRAIRNEQCDHHLERDSVIDPSLRAIRNLAEFDKTIEKHGGWAYTFMTDKIDESTNEGG